MRDQPLSVGIDYNAPVAFCVWALVSDGLHVPPFDVHPDGDRLLRAVGLTEQL